MDPDIIFLATSVGLISPTSFSISCVSPELHTVCFWEYYGLCDTLLSSTLLQQRSRPETLAPLEAEAGDPQIQGLPVLEAEFKECLSSLLRLKVKR